ncbi:MAG: tripartite tricarboxylate transporter substrate binding protein [Hyphomicrobiales bacterium]|nr:tripartite tricarboxylate transporter substrate binding protein [Hyphomicrobiales bacterium]
MLKTFIRGVALAACAGGTIALASAPANAEDAKAFYKGKKVTIIVPYGAGGGYDTYARIMAPHFARKLDATVIVQNKPGGGGMIGVNYVANGEKDGTLLVFFQGTSIAASQLIGVKNVRYDLLKMQHIATVAWSPWLLLARNDAPFNSIADMKKLSKPITFGGNGPSSADTSGGRAACMALELKCKHVVGYRGSRAASLALSRGEIDAYYVSDSSAFKYVKAKAAKPIAVMSHTRSIFFPKVKRVFEQAKVNERGQWIIGFHNRLEKIGRILSAPEGTPADRVALLRKVAREILTDPKFVAEAKEKKRDILFSSGKDTEQNVKEILSINPDRKKLASQIIQGK